MLSGFPPCSLKRKTVLTILRNRFWNANDASVRTMTGLKEVTIRGFEFEDNF